MFDLTKFDNYKRHQTIIDLGKDVQTQTNLISKQTEVIINSQRSQALTNNSIANAIISSHERMAEHIDNVRYSIEEVRDGINGLKAAFEWGLADVTWQIEQNTRVLQEILSTLQRPLDTQAKELRNRAERAYQNGWIEDALEDFLASETKNRYDFTIHINLGNLYLFHKREPAKAFEYYEKAAKYARPDSHYYTSYAFLHLAFIKSLAKDFKEAERLTQEAILLQPDFAEVLYQNALYNVCINNTSQSIQSLEKAIKLDINYCEKILSEPDFKPINSEITELFEKLRTEKKNTVINNYEEVKLKKIKLDEILQEITNQNLVKEISQMQQSYQNTTDRINALIKRNSYRDYLEAENKVTILNNELSQLTKKITSLLQSKIYSRLNEARSAIDEMEKKNNKTKDALSEIFVGYILPSWINCSIIISSLIIQGGVYHFAAYLTSYEYIYYIFICSFIPLLNIIISFFLVFPLIGALFKNFGPSLLTLLLSVVILYSPSFLLGTYRENKKSSLENQSKQDVYPLEKVVSKL